MPEIQIRPLQSCVPQDLQGSAAWFQNWNDQMQTVGLTLGFEQDELDRIKDDNLVVQFLASSAISVEAFSSAVTSYRRVMLTAPIGTATPVLPGLPSMTPPVVVVDAGIWDRLNKDIVRVRVYPVFTEETGSLLGVNPTQSEGKDPTLVKPDLALSAAMHGFVFSVVVSGREDADMWEVWGRVSGQTEYQLLKTSTGKSTDVTYNPGGSSLAPVILEVYVQLRRNDANYGQPSNIGLVTVNP